MYSSSQHLPQKKEQSATTIRIETVKGRRAVGRFIKVPWSIYSDDAAWVPPLLMERRQHLSPKNPYFAHAQFCSWIAYRGKRPVGRISAQLDQLHLERHQDDAGFFGMLEAEDDAEIFEALTHTAEMWLRKKGARRIMGPFNLSINQESGLLVQGFDTPPSLMMGHARPYYGHRIEEQGYGKKKDLLAYLLDSSLTLPSFLRKLPERSTRDVHVRPLRTSRFSSELEILRDIHEDAWSRNWGFIPFTKEEFKQLGREIKFLVDEDLVQIAEVRGAPAAMIVMLPNINEAIRDLNGRIFPFGWMKLLWRLKVSYPGSARVPLMGVRRRYHGSLIGAMLAFRVIDAVIKSLERLGIRKVEMSWILEDNTGMRNIIESLGGIAYKRYRVYGKEL